MKPVFGPLGGSECGVLVLVVVLAATFCGAGATKPEQPEQERAKVLREAAQDWIQIGIAQSKRGLYEQAEKSLLAARAYQEYLTADEHKRLEEQLNKAHQANLERQAVLEHIQNARELVKQGQPIKARAHYEKVRKSTYLTKEERKQIAGELENIDKHFDKRSREITDLYNRSVVFYRAGELEKAREGFVEVAKYGLLVAPEGQRAEDYLIQIDSILTERLKHLLPAESSPPRRGAAESAGAQGSLLAAQQAAQETKTPDANRGSEQDAQRELLQVVAEPQPPSAPQRQRRQPTEEQAAVAEGDPGPPVEAPEGTDKEPAEPAVTETRASIIRGYTKAVVENTAAKVESCITRGEFGRAVVAVRLATEVVKENRQFLGDDLFAQYSIWLKELADKIVAAQKAR